MKTREISIEEALEGVTKWFNRKIVFSKVQ